ncbi:MAG: glutathione S-transferase N-terminal domain-containing protein [Rhodospirillaceae bacterium]|nr:glutathione S-transferase N-terminal domain-containing protein [Rhodospirillaceae bacterium]
MIELYTAARTPNGHKISIMLEETGLPYRAIRIRLGKGDQRHPTFLAMNGNGRIPVIRDTENDTVLAESGAILLYLAEKSGRFNPTDPALRYRTLQWIMFQMGHVGPMLGQLWHFMHADPPNPRAVERFYKECDRILGVLDLRLRESPYLAGEEYGIADIATFPWADNPKTYGFRDENYPHLTRWLKKIGARPAVERGTKVPDDTTPLAPWASETA